MTYSQGLAALFLVLASTVTAGAHPDQNPPEQQATTAPATKKPPLPLFPKHRRGIYKNSEGIDVVDATPQSPPLDSDDPGVPDEGEWEINLTTHADLAHPADRVDLLFVDANYGILPKIAGHELPTQIKVEFPIAAARTDGDPFTFGVGAAAVGLKFNWYHNEHTGLSMSVYPQLEFAAPGSDAVGKGLAEPGSTFILPLLVAREFHSVIFVANGGVETPVHAPERDVAGEYGVAFGRALTRKLAGMIELRGESAFAADGERLMLLNAGVIRGIRNVIVYGNVGHSVVSSDHASHSYVGLGIKLIRRKGAGENLSRRVSRRER